jgi:hypothetical protein
MNGQFPVIFSWCLLSTQVVAALAPAAVAGPDSLWTHVGAAADLGDLRSMVATWEGPTGGRVLKITSREDPPALSPASIVPSHLPPYAWVVIPPPPGGWKLERRAAVEAEITNTGGQSATVLLWVVSRRGWDAVPDVASLKPGETRRYRCNLRETYPDGTPKIDPGQVKQIQIMVRGKLARPVALEVRGLVATGEAAAWARPPGRLEVPDVEDRAPAPGRRVRYRLPGDEETGIYGVLQLPNDWRPGGRYPVIVEYPGNIYYVNDCYSTGLPDQCTIGFGMTKAQGAICLGLPFVDRRAGALAESGWGNPDDTAAYAMRMVDAVCAKFGGDRANLVLTGFSRGGIACGFIGLRDDRMAALWKGFHVCQGYDGQGWTGATIEGALERAPRFRGEAVFQTDTPAESNRRVTDAMRTSVTYAKSGLGAHATAMFLDDRPSTLRLRHWFAELVGSK